MPPSERFTLGEFRLDPANECLWRGDSSFPLRPKAYALLLYFCENPGRILSKRELMDAVWGDAIVGDSVLKVCVRELRKVLDDSTAEPRFIETVHRRGYRFRGAEPPKDEGAGDNRAKEERTVRAERPATVKSALVGREDELDQLRGHLDAVQRGDRRVVFVSGGPGIGKTALIESFLGELATGDELWIASGQCLDQFGTGEAYLPVLDALSGLARGAEREALARWLRERAPTWAAQLPAILSPAERAALESELFGATQARMLREILEALEALTEERTLVLCLEDVHWADPSTVDLLAAFGRRTARARVLIVCTVRPVDLILADHPLKAVKRDLEGRRLAHEIHMRNLTPDECLSFAERRLGGSPPERLAAWAHEHTDGNPLFLANLLESLLQQGAVAREGQRLTLVGKLEDEAVPESVLALIEAMVERRSHAEQRALEAAAVAGAEFSSTAVAAILLEPQAEVEGRLDALARVGFFIESLASYELPDGTPSQRYRFVHALYSMALLRRLPAGRSRVYHERNAARGVAAYGERVGEVAGEVAREYELGGQPREAARFLGKAARECLRRYAVREACGHLERALELCDSIEGAERVSARLSSFEALGLARRTGGDMIGAAEAFEGMALQAGAAGRSADAVRARLFEASALSWHDRAGCLAAIDAAMAEEGALPDGVVREHARGSAAYWRLLWEGRTEADAKACESARAAAFIAGDRLLEGLHSVRLAWFHWLGGRYRDAVAMAREGVALSAANRDFFDYLLGQYFLAWALLHSGAWGEMRRVLSASLRIADRNGHLAWAVLFRLLEAWLHHEARDFERARDLAARAGEQAAALGHDYPRLLADTILGLAYLGTGEEDAAFERFERVRGEDADRVLMGWTLRMIASSGWARAELHRGELDAVEREIRALASKAEASGERTAASLARRTLAQIAARRGEQQRAREEIEFAIAHVQPEPAPLAAWRVHVAAAEIIEPTDAEAARAHVRRAGEVLRELADSLDEGDPLRETVLSDWDREGE